MFLNHISQWASAYNNNNVTYNLLLDLVSMEEEYLDDDDEQEEMWKDTGWDEASTEGMHLYIVKYIQVTGIFLESAI